MEKALVSYFSASGVTAKVAKTLAEAAGAALYEIKPAEPYTPADLDWTNKRSRSSMEMNDKASRPALADRDAKIEDYDVVFLCFPIWWYVAPTIINTFLESYDFSGKTIILFATSGGSGLGRSAASLRGSVAANTKIIEGRMLNGRLNVFVSQVPRVTSSEKVLRRFYCLRAFLIGRREVMLRTAIRLFGPSPGALSRARRDIPPPCIAFSIPA